MIDSILTHIWNKTEQWTRVRQGDGRSYNCASCLLACSNQRGHELAAMF